MLPDWASRFWNTASTPQTDGLEHEPLELSEISIYPIKSCRGFTATEWPYSFEGLQYDRQWMVVDARTHRFISGRSHAKLVLISPTIDLATSTLSVTVPSGSTLRPGQCFTVPLEPTECNEYHTDLGIWISPPQEGYDVGSGPLNDALSEFLGLQVKLMRKGTGLRTAGKYGAVERLKLDLDYLVVDERTLPEVDALEIEAGGEIGKQAGVSWADGFPFLFATEASNLAVKALASDPSNEMKFPGWDPKRWGNRDNFNPKRFRANITVKGAAAWEEDGWLEVNFEHGDPLSTPSPTVTAASSVSELQETPAPDALIDYREPGLGDVSEQRHKKVETMFVTSRCPRCPIPQIDPSTAEKDAIVPAKVMKSTRSVGQTTKHAVCFGVNAVPKALNGFLRVGDYVRVVRRCAQDPETGEWLRPEDERAVKLKARQRQEV